MAKSKPPKILAQKMYHNLDTYYRMGTMNLINPRYKYNDKDCLSWTDYAGIIKADSYNEFYKDCLDKLQYSLMIDDNLIQLYYEDNGKQIFKSSLSFIPYPDNGLTYFRFDLGPHTDYYHTLYHVHFGYYSQQFRLCLLHFPYPSEFLNFIKTIAYSSFSKKYDANKFLKDLNYYNYKFNHSLVFEL